MTIFYDFEVRATPEQTAKMYSGKSGIILTEMKNFVEKQLSVLKEEIEGQEGYTMICILITSKLEIRHYHFTEDLGQKMNSCISQKDYEYITEKIWRQLYPGVIPPTN
jgi:hypothetical protein